MQYHCCFSFQSALKPLVFVVPLSTFKVQSKKKFFFFFLKTLATEVNFPFNVSVELRTKLSSHKMNHALA